LTKNYKVDFLINYSCACGQYLLGYQTTIPQQSAVSGQ